jgi:DNA-binding beta-propeller fold protein YncE
MRKASKMISRPSFAVSFAFAMLSLAATLGLGVTPAEAAISHPFLSSFDGHETPAGSLGTTGAVAVDGAGGRVYVTDVANNAIDEFDSSDKYVAQITGAGTPSGSFSLVGSGAIAVDNSTDPSDAERGNLYVVDTGNGVIDKFDSTGAYVGQFPGPFGGVLLGVGVDGEGDVWVYDEAGDVYELQASTGGILFQYNTGRFPAPPFAVDSTRHTYTGNFFGVERADAQGQSEGSLEECGLCQAAIATDLADDNVYIDRRTVITQYDSDRTPVGEFGETQLASGGEGGIAVNPRTGRIYVANAADQRVYVFAAAPGPRVVPESATNVQARSASVNAEINPEGTGTSYQFEYGETTKYGEIVPAAPADAGSGTSLVAVNAALTGLEGGTTYHYRVVATNANGSSTSADRTFTTTPVAVIQNAEASEVTGTEAALSATINPHELETTYRFEWGASTTYGSAAPVPDGQIGAGDAPVFVAQRINGLSPGITYHWRVVATADGEETVSADHTFIFEDRAALPDGRAYEMVTPPNKNGALLGAVFILGVPPIVSSDGTRVMSSSVQCFAAAKSCPANRGHIGSPYSFTRTTSGWQAAALSPSAEIFESASIWQFGASEGSVLFSAPNSDTHEDDFYVGKSDGTFSKIGPVTSPAEGRGTVAVTTTFASAGVRKLVWTTLPDGKWPFDDTLDTASATMYELDAGAEQPRLVAVNGGKGSDELIGVCGEVPVPAPGVVSEDGEAIFFTVANCEQGGTGPGGEPNGVDLPVEEMFARVGGATTVALSEPQSSASCTTVECLANTGPTHSSKFRSAQFVGASSDASVAYFESPQQLTNGATQDEKTSDDAKGFGGCNETTSTGCNLYSFECVKCTGVAERKLVDISAGDVSGGGPRVKGVEAVSQDGSHVYFVAQGVLTTKPNSFGQHALSRRDNLYVYQRDAAQPSEAVSFIATLPESDSPCEESLSVTSCEWSAGTDVSANVTPGGRYLVFMSRGKLTPDDQSTTGALQVFRYDSLTGELVRISKGDGGFNDNGDSAPAANCESGFCSNDARIAPGRVAESLTEPRFDPTMSDNGSYVFFQSPLALASGALDDVKIGVTGMGLPQYAQNVYEWHDGRVSLISDGRDATANNGQSAFCNPGLSTVCLLGTDRTGADVFFSTADSLVPGDTDTEMDYYDARICTAASPCISAAPATTTATCEGEACHLAATALPSAGAPASATVAGQGSLVAPLAAAATPRKKKTAAQVRAEKLGKALKVCKKKARAKRASCEKRARKRYGRAK